MPVDPMVLTQQFYVGLIPLEAVGSATWSVECRNLSVASSEWRRDSGTIEIVAPDS
jgi:hypothetical protein